MSINIARLKFYLEKVQFLIAEDINRFSNIGDYKRILSKILPVFFILLGLYVGLMIAIQYIPNESIMANITKSAETLQKEGPRRIVFPGFFERYRTLDGHTDCLMIDMAVKPHHAGAVNSAMLNECYCHLESDGQPNGYEFANDLFNVSKGKTEGLELYRYGRCWNGYLVVLKPLLVLMDFNQIRILNIIILYLLMVICVVLIYRKLSPFLGISFAFLLVYFNFYLSPMSLQYMQGAFIVLLCSVLVLVSKRLTQTISNLCLFFFIIGSVMAFVDVLTLPQLTLGLPLLFVFLVKKMKMSMMDVVIICICWLIGYSLTWGSKFLIGSVLTGTNLLTDALHAAQMRTSSSIGSEKISLLRVGSSLRILIPIAVLFIGFIPYYIKNRQSNIDFRRLSPIFLIAMIVPMWFVVLSNHSIVHILFTYRAWILPVFSVIVLLYYTIDQEKIFSIKKR